MGWPVKLPGSILWVIFVENLDWSSDFFSSLICFESQFTFPQWTLLIFYVLSDFTFDTCTIFFLDTFFLHLFIFFCIIWRHCRSLGVWRKYMRYASILGEHEAVRWRHRSKLHQNKQKHWSPTEPLWNNVVSGKNYHEVMLFFWMHLHFRLCRKQFDWTKTREITMAACVRVMSSVNKSKCIIII